MVISLLKVGADPNSKTSDNYTPLYFACENGHLKTVEALVKGIELNGKVVCARIDEKCGQDYGTALEVARAKGHMNIVEWLTKNGAPVQARGKH